MIRKNRNAIMAIPFSIMFLIGCSTNLSSATPNTTKANHIIETPTATFTLTSNTDLITAVPSPTLNNQILETAIPLATPVLPLLSEIEASSGCRSKETLLTQTSVPLSSPTPTINPMFWRPALSFPTRNLIDQRQVKNCQYFLYFTFTQNPNQYYFSIDRCEGVRCGLLTTFQSENFKYGDYPYYVAFAEIYKSIDTSVLLVISENYILWKRTVH